MISRELLHATNSLRAHAPVEWEAFLKELQMHAITLREDCIHSPLDGLQVAQGRARLRQVHDRTSTLYSSGKLQCPFMILELEVTGTPKQTCQA